MNLTSRLFRLLRLLALASLSVWIATPVFASTYSDNGGGTVTNPVTGITWMRCSMGQTWTGNTCTATYNAYPYYIRDQAVALTGTVTFAGNSDSRLPSVRELQTIVDRSHCQPAIDSMAFANPSSSSFRCGSLCARDANVGRGKKRPQTIS